MEEEKVLVHLNNNTPQGNITVILEDEFVALCKLPVRIRKALDYSHFDYSTIATLENYEKAKIMFGAELAQNIIIKFLKDQDKFIAGIV